MLAQKQTLQKLHDLKPATLTWAQQMDDLKAMWLDGVPTDEIAERLGRTRSSVLTQAVRAGLERRAAPGRKPQGTTTPRAPKKPALRVVQTNILSFPVRGYSGSVVQTTQPADKKSRTCLMCSTSFQSHGSHNRICNRCKDCAGYQAGHDQEYSILTA